jgi:hypothetical protein
MHNNKFTDLHDAFIETTIYTPTSSLHRASPQPTTRTQASHQEDPDTITAGVHCHQELQNGDNNQAESHLQYGGRATLIDIQSSSIVRYTLYSTDIIIAGVSKSNERLAQQSGF